MMRIIFYTIFFAISFIVVVSPTLAHFEDKWQPIVTCTKNCTLCDLFHTGQHVISFLTFILAIPLAVIGILIGGTLIMLSGGNESLFQRGKEALRAAVIGLVIVLVAWVVINTIIVVLNSGGQIDLSNWFNLPCL